jgi:hypothetical protein
MERITVCPCCGIKDPLLTLVNITADLEDGSIPDRRTFKLICIACDGTVATYDVDNTIKAVAALRGELDKCYGPSRIIPSFLYT